MKNRPAANLSLFFAKTFHFLLTNSREFAKMKPRPTCFVGILKEGVSHAGIEHTAYY